MAVSGILLNLGLCALFVAFALMVWLGARRANRRAIPRFLLLLIGALALLGVGLATWSELRRVVSYDFHVRRAS